MSESTGKGHQVPDSTSLSIRLATEYNEPTVPGTTGIVPGGLGEFTVVSDEDVQASAATTAVAVKPLLRRLQWHAMNGA